MISQVIPGVAAGTPSSVLAAEFQVPDVEYSRLAPLLIVFGVAVLGVLFEAFLPRQARYWAQVALAAIGYAAAFVMTLRLVGDEGQLIASGALAIDGFTDRKSVV